jgi:hypothetical protein
LSLFILISLYFSLTSLSWVCLNCSPSIFFTYFFYSTLYIYLFHISSIRHSSIYFSPMQVLCLKSSISILNLFLISIGFLIITYY